MKIKIKSNFNQQTPSHHYRHLKNIEITTKRSKNKYKSSYNNNNK